MNWKFWVGLTMFVGGIALGLYVGVWLLFIGGIVQVIQAATADPVSAMGVAVGLFRIVAASAAGTLSAMFLVIPGWAMLMAAVE